VSLRRRLVFALYIPSILSAIAYSLLIPVMPIFAGELTSSYAIIGIILAAETFGVVFGDIPASWFIRRIGIKNTMIVGIAGAITPFILLFFAQTVLATVVLLFLAGLGHALYNISRHAYVTVAIQLDTRGRAISLLGGSYRIGRFIGPLLGGWIGGNIGLRYVFLMFVVVSLVTLFFVWRFMEQYDFEAHEESSHERSQIDMFRDMFREQGRILTFASLGQILAQTTRQGWTVIVPLYASDILGLDVQAIGLIMGIGASVDALIFYSSGIIMDRWGRKWAIVPSFTLQATGLIMVLFAQNELALTAIAIFIGLANGISSGTMMTLGSDLAPDEMRGEFLSVWRLIGDVGFMATPIVIGAIAQVFALQVSIVFIVGAGYTAASSFAFFVPETLARKRKKST